MNAPKDVFLYRNASVMPRAFVVSGYRVAPLPEDAKAILQQDSFSPEKEAIVSRPVDFPSVAWGKAGSAEIKSYEPSTVTIDASLNTDGLLILSDTYYPGWKAYVDGTEKEILKVNFCQRGVVLPPGKHRVTFSFESATARGGFKITIGSILIVGLLLFAARKKA
jgi:hypothetical protein